MHSTQNLLALALIKGVGATFIKKNLLVVQQSVDKLELLAMLGGKVNLLALKETLPQAIKILKSCENQSIRVVSILDEAYPPLLKRIKDPPPLLYLKGDISLLAQAVGIVGTRASTALGNQIAGRVGAYFSQNWSLCNVLTEGIAQHAILQNDEVVERVIGVISGGLNFEQTTSPATRIRCAQVLEKKGLLVSENPPNKEEDRFSGRKVSRLQAGLSRALILIQSNTSGSTKHALKTFVQQPRPLGVIAFSAHKAFQEDIFAANRLILKNPKDGLATFCTLKNRFSIKVSAVVPLESKADYQQLEEKIKAVKSE